MSKRLGSPYRSGRSRHWVKSKNPKHPAVKREAYEDWGKSNGDNLYLLLKKKMSGQERATRIHSRNPSAPG